MRGIERLLAAILLAAAVAGAAVFPRLLDRPAPGGPLVVDKRPPAAVVKAAPAPTPPRAVRTSRGPAAQPAVRPASAPATPPAAASAVTPTAAAGPVKAKAATAGAKPARTTPATRTLAGALLPPKAPEQPKARKQPKQPKPHKQPKQPKPHKPHEPKPAKARAPCCCLMARSRVAIKSNASSQLAARKAAVIAASS